MNKKIRWIIFFSILLFVPILSVQAKEDEIGSLEIQLEDLESNNSKENVEIGIMKIANWKNGSFELIPKLKEEKIQINEMRNSKEIEQEINKMESIKSADITKKTNAKGNVIFSNLSYGMYFVFTVDPAFYDKIPSTFVSVPNWDEVEHCMNKNVLINAKHEPFPEIEIKKIDGDTKKEINKKYSFILSKENEVEKKTRINQKSIVFTLRKEGTYWLKEVDPPKGYSIKKDPIKIVYKNNELWINNQKQNLKGKYPIVYTVKNWKKADVKTGKNQNKMQYLCLLILSSIVLLSISNSKQKVK